MSWATAGVLLACLALVFTARLGLASLYSGQEPEATATPTKTPRVLTAPALAAVPLAAPDLPAATPEPEATATPTLPPSTATATPPATPTALPLPDALAGVVAHFGIDAARRFVVVDPDEQRMLLWTPAEGLKEMPVSTGDPGRGYTTRAWYGLVGDYVGTFHSFDVYADEGWYLFEDVGGAILVHGAPYKWANGAKVYENLDALGNYPASRGCIRLSPEDARWFTAWRPQGVPLVILPHGNDVQSRP